MLERVLQLPFQVVFLSKKEENLLKQSGTFKAAYDQTAKKIGSNANEWKKFLRFSSKLHKYSFAEKIMIYSQNPDVEFLADAQTWNSLGRLIKKDGEGIFTIDDRSDRVELKQLFDISQTKGEEIQLPEWQVERSEAAQIIGTLHQRVFNHEDANLPMDTAILELISHGVVYYGKEKSNPHIWKFVPLIEESVSYMLGQKADWLRQVSDELLLGSISYAKPGVELNTIGWLSNEISKNLLVNLYSIKNQLMNQKEEQHAKQAKDDDFHQSSVRSTVAGLREGSKSVLSGKSTDRVHDDDDGRHIDGTDAQNSGQIDRERDITGEGVSEAATVSENEQSRDTGSTPKTDSVSSERTSHERNDNRNRKIDDTREDGVEDHSAPSSFVDTLESKAPTKDIEETKRKSDLSESIQSGAVIAEKGKEKPTRLEPDSFLRDFAKFGSLTPHGKYKMYDLFKESSDLEKLSEVVAFEHELGGVLFRGNLLSFDEKGVNRHGEQGVPKMIASWLEFAQEIKQLVDTEQYLTDEQKKGYDDYMAAGRLEFDDDEKIQAAKERSEISSERSVESTEPFEELSLFNFSDEEENNSIEVKEEKRPNQNYYSVSKYLYKDSKREKYADNVQAIKLLKQIEQGKDEVTRENQIALSKYSGWGGLSEVFDERNGSWSEEYNELKGQLSEDEYERARKSVLTAFFTPMEIIHEMYHVLSKYFLNDFSARTILDPSMGTGNFFMFQPKQIRNAQKIGIEIDSITGRIAKQLFPDAEIHNTGFENVQFKEKVDAIISNIPFNDIKIRDKKYEKYNFSIHDYFLAKSVDTLKEHGIMLLISSTATMDKKNIKAREYVAKKADLLGAIRMPKTAFKQSAGTEVITDILIFKKKSYAEMTKEYVQPDWVTSSSHPEHDGIFMNNYFLNNQEKILGTIAIKNFHGQTLDLLPNDKGPLNAQIRSLVDQMIEKQVITTNQKGSTQKAQKSDKTVVEPSVPKEIVIPSDARKYSFLNIHGTIVYHTIDGDFEELPAGKREKKVRGMLEVKKATNDLIHLQKAPYKDEDFREKLVVLNQRYDRFTKKFGFFNEKTNIRDLRMDDQYPLLRSLEKETGDTFVKQDFFFRPTIQPVLEILEVDTAAEALQLSLAKTASVDFDFMKEKYPGKSEDQIIKELGNQIYLNPTKLRNGYYHAWEYVDEYLTGNVREKLEIATIVNDTESDESLKQQYEKNVDALTKALPESLQAGDVDFQLGSPWIPKKYYNEFIYQLLDIPNYQRGEEEYDVCVDYLEHNSTWKVFGIHKVNSNVLAGKTYGTERKNALEIIEAAMNLQQIRVNDRELDPLTGNVKYVLNPEETMIAREKQMDIEDSFQEWLFSDRDRRAHLLEIYNHRFNNIVPRKYNGDSLIFEGMNSQMTLRKHQKDVVARTLFSGKALMAHEVGAGKTAAMTASGMYLKKNGLIGKPIFVVPNHLTEQWGREILTFYPNANVLITTKKDFEKSNRKAFVSRIATGEYDAVIIGQSQFERIPLSAEFQIKVLRRELKRAVETMERYKEEKGLKWTVKQMEKFKENLEIRLEKLAKEEKKDDLLTFEQLGVDFLFVDEAHAYKNLFTYTKMQNVAGIGKSNSQRAMDMLMKVRYMQENHEGGHVVFATGTPISNSMSEMYVMQYFLQPEELNNRGLTSFDAWAATFGKVVSSLEITPEGSGYRMRDRFSKFHNLPELMNMFNLMADVQTADMLNLPVPTLKTGQVQTIVTKKTDFQEKLMQEFVSRSEDIRKGNVAPHEDNMLKLTHEAKLMAIDARLIDPNQPRDPESKLSICCDITYRIWKETQENRSTQMIFSDSGTPKPTGFNVYDEIKQQLIERGVPAEEIAFIHDAKTDLQKDTLFEKVRSGEVRVLLGSTQKVGTGTNVQHKLIAAHHIDCPWKPSDLTQREGRILRQGNENDEVSIYRYVTKGTFDSYLWQIQEQKLTYISQVMSGKSISRSCEDLDETVLSASEVKAIATENPLLAEKMSVDNEVSKLRIIKSRWESQRSRMDEDLRITYPNKSARLNELLKKYETDKETIDKNQLDQFKMTINGVEITDRNVAFKQMEREFMLAGTGANGILVVKIGEFRGLNVKIVKEHTSAQHLLVIEGEQKYETTFNLETGIGNITRLMNLPNRIEESIGDTKDELSNLDKQIAYSEAEIDKPFNKQEELDSLVAKQREINKQMELSTLKKEAGNEPKEAAQSMGM